MKTGKGSIDYNDIIFAGRNKAYGAYELRKNYGVRLFKSFKLVVILAAVFAFSSAMSMKKPSTILEKNLALKQITLLEPPPIDPKKPLPIVAPQPPAPIKPTVKFTPPIIKKDDEVKDIEILPEQKDVVVPGLKPEKGDPKGIDPMIVVDQPHSSVVPDNPPSTIFTYVEQMPAPSYDRDKYLHDNLKYPASAHDNNISGRVIVKFIVDENGAVGDVQIVRGIGGGCDEEAKRVVSSMPKWKPGKQNGKPVKVYFTLPINFTLE